MHHDQSALNVHSTDSRTLDLPPVRWALGQIWDAVRADPHAALDTDRLIIRLLPVHDASALATSGLGDTPMEPESFGLRVKTEPDGSIAVTVAASDARGYSYALTEIAERIKFGGADGLSDQVQYEHAAAPVRGILRSFSSAHEDLQWFHDRSFWTSYLDHLATQRFNRFQLALGMQYNYGAGMESRTATDNYLCFAYPFVLAVPGFDVRAQGVTHA